MSKQTKTKMNVVAMTRGVSNNVSVTHDIIAILDDSGSMGSMGKEPLEALNAFIKDQQETLTGDGATFSLWLFNSQVKLMIDDQKLEDVKPVISYAPGGMTAMCDAIGKAINTKRQKDKNENVICMVITDGAENSSREFSRDDIRRLVHKAEKEWKWKFIFIGAKDIFAEGERTGFNKRRCAAFVPGCPGNLVAMTRGVSNNVSQYRCATMAGGTCDLDLDVEQHAKSAPAAILSRSHGQAQASPLPMPVPHKAGGKPAVNVPDPGMLGGDPYKDKKIAQESMSMARAAAAIEPGGGGLWGGDGTVWHPAMPNIGEGGGFGTGGGPGGGAAAPPPPPPPANPTRE